MNRTNGFASRVGTAALSMGIVFASIPSAFGQGRVSIGDYYGAGPEGTIGRGTNRLPGGPSDWGGGRGPGYWGVNPSPSGRYYGSGYPTYTYDRGYSSPPTTSSRRVAPTPYLTNQHYEPGDGYRYPLYYNPATRTYFYYPVARMARSDHR